MYEAILIVLFVAVWAGLGWVERATLRLSEPPRPPRRARTWPRAVIAASGPERRAQGVGP